MATSSTLKTLKEQDGPVDPREQPVPPRSSSLAGRLLTWRQSIWRRRWLSIITAWSICVVGWAAIMLWPTRYDASALLYVDLTKLAYAEAADDQPAVMLRSMMLTEENLDAVRSEGALGPEKNRSLADDIRLRSTVPTVFALAYEHESPVIAKQVLDDVIAAFQLSLETNPSPSVLAAVDLDRQIDEQRRKIREVDEGLEAFTTENAEYLEGSGSKEAELAILNEEISALDRQMDQAIESREEIARALTEARARENDADLAEIREAKGLLATERETLEVELTKLQQRYADTHPYVIAVIEAISALDDEMGALDASAAEQAGAGQATREELEQQQGELIAEVSTLKSRLDEKRRQIELLEALTRTTTSVEADLSGLEAEKAELETELAGLLQRSDEMEQVIGGEAQQENFRLIRQPELPTDPIGPSRLAALAVVLLGGSVLGAVVAMACNRYKGVFESAWQLRQRFDVGVLGTISEVLTPAERKQLGYSRLAFGLACLALVGIFSGLAIAELTNSLAPFGDSLRTRLLG